MKELIKINNQGDKQLVSARDLYIGLGLNKAAWARWYKGNIQENDFFNEGIDWIGVQHDVEGNETMDFAISIDFAKHIAMMARTHKSHEYRNYFIKCEEKAKQQALDTAALSPELQMFNSLFNALAKNELQQKKLGQAIEETKAEIKEVREVIEVKPSDNWRADTNNLVKKICFKANDYKLPKEKIYKALEERAGCDLKRRLENMKGRVLLNGSSKSKVDQLNYLDVIAEDKKLIEIYTAIVKEMAIKYSV